MQQTTIIDVYILLSSITHDITLRKYINYGNKMIRSKYFDKMNIIYKSDSKLTFIQNMRHNKSKKR